jgi:DNA mismatch repair protein MutS
MKASASSSAPAPAPASSAVSTSPARARSTPPQAADAPGDDDDLVRRSGVVLAPGTRVTPMLRQWLQAKAKAPDAILLFRMGDFYELFGEDAHAAGRVLDLAVTTRDRDKGDDAMPMAGFPHPAAPGYIAKLIAAGLKVAVCDQLEDPALARGIVKRGVTRLVTPGMVLDEESLDARSNNFLVGVVDDGGDGEHRFGLCALDVSTGEILCTTAPHESAVVDEVQRLSPRELVVGEGLAAAFVERLRENKPGAAPRRLETRRVERARSGRRTLVDTLGTPDPLLQEGARRTAIAAAELCLLYAQETAQGTLPRHLQPPRAYVLDERLLLDATTRAHLDLCGPPGDLRKPGTLLWHVDRTRTAAGGRRLLRLLLQPSASLPEVEARLDRTAALVDDPAARAALGELLTATADVERLVARASNGRAGPRDLWRLHRALERFPAIGEALVDHGAWMGVLAPLATAIERCSVVSEELGRALHEQSPTVLGDEPAFRPGYDRDLDELVTLKDGGAAQIGALEAAERERTGIPSLKIKHNSVFGYYLEVTKTHQGKVPAHYQRKQTVANGERYVTDELRALEEQVEGADGRRRRREQELFAALLERVAGDAGALLAVAAFVADVDATLCLAEVAVADRMVRPQLLPREQRSLVVEDARHPVVERLCRQRGDAFVPASVTLDEQRQILVVTGPNMAGKSTVMREVALCQILAQAGSFVPARSATLSLCDRVFTRVGASDDIASGRSTFMVEMTETSHILRGATPWSLVLLDEIGRGTATFDGLAIAWAVAEHLHDVTGARTLFATHYHELTDLALHLPRLKNVHVVVKEWGDDVVFVRSLEDGPAGRSFGVAVARLAGLPEPVVARARAVLAHLEGDDAAVPDGTSATGTTPNATPEKTPSTTATTTTTTASSHGLPRAHRRPSRGTPTPQLALFQPPATAVEPVVDERAARVLEKLRATDVMRLTPLQALNALAALVDDARRS